MRQLILIHPDDHVIVVQAKEPTRAELVTLLQRHTGDDHALIEHVTVLYQGRRAHAFVHATGEFKSLPMNRKATLVYHNATRHQQYIETYDDLHEDLPIDSDRWCGYLNQPFIYGPMILWTGPLPFWEPENAPWRDYETDKPPFAATSRRAVV